VALNSDQAVELTRALDDLRESDWPDVLTQSQLAKALSAEGRLEGQRSAHGKRQAIPRRCRI
jgi:hypothetical protein